MAQTYGAAGQTCSALYVFSTQLANRAAQTVSCHQFSNIIEFHRSQQETRRLLAISPSSTKSIKSVAQDCKKRPASVMSSSDGSSGAPLLDNAGSVKDESIKTADQELCQKQERKLPLPPPTPRPEDNPTADIVEDDCSKSSVADNPLEKMARLTEEVLLFEPPTKQGKLCSPRDRSRFTDEQLTPAQRQHRQEALQRIEDLKNFFGMSQQQQSVMAMNAAATVAAAGGSGQPPPPQFGQPFCGDESTKPTMMHTVENSNGPNAVMMPGRSEQQMVEAQLQWQQLVAEHEAKKQMHQNILPPSANQSTVPPPQPPPTLPTDATFLRPGTCMMVQGKPAVMVTPVASPRNPQRARAPRTQVADVYMEGHANAAVNQGPPYPYDVDMRQPIHIGMTRPAGPRFMSTTTFRAAGQEMNHAIESGAYMSVGPEENYVDQCSFIRAGPSYASYMQQQPLQQQPHEMGEYMAATSGMKMAPGPSQVPAMGPNMGTKPPPFVGQTYEYDMQSAGGNVPMVNNTYVNATMSIQQVNIQNVSPYPGGVVSMPGRPPPPTNQGCLLPQGPTSYATMMQPVHHRAPVQQSGCFPPPTSVIRHGLPGSAPQQSSVRPMYMSAEGMCFAPMDMAGNALANNGSFFADFAEPLTNLDSKVPSQKLQYFPNPTQQQQQYQKDCRDGCTPY